MDRLIDGLLNEWYYGKVHALFAASLDRFIYTRLLLKLQITIEATILKRENFDEFLSDWMIVDSDNLVNGDKFWLNNNNNNSNNNGTTVTS